MAYFKVKRQKYFLAFLCSLFCFVGFAVYLNFVLTGTRIHSSTTDSTSANPDKNKVFIEVQRGSELTATDFVASKVEGISDLSNSEHDNIQLQIHTPKRHPDEFTIRQQDLQSVLKKNSAINENRNPAVVIKKNLREDVVVAIEAPKEAVIEEPIVLSLGRPATADVRGNLGPPDVVTNEDVADWLKDRWQAAKDLTGAPIPGEHWLEIDLQRVCTITKVMIDWEKAYSNAYTIVGRAYIKKLNDLGVETFQEVWVELAKSKQSRALAFDNTHIIHEAMISNDVSVYLQPDKRMPIPPIRFVRLIIHRPAQQWGSSVWRFVIYGFELPSHF